MGYNPMMGMMHPMAAPNQMMGMHNPMMPGGGMGLPVQPQPNSEILDKAGIRVMN